MKPFLGINLSSDEGNELLNGNEFLVAKPSAILTDALDSVSGKTQKIVKKSQLPLPLRIIMYACELIALIIIGGLLRADVSPAESYHNAPWLYWLCAVCVIIGILLFILGKRKERQVLEDTETKRTLSDSDAIEKEILAELSVPDNAREVDVLSFCYKEENETIKMAQKGVPLTNMSFHIFTDSENLYLADLDGKYAFPLSSIQVIQTIRKHVTVMDWNKDEPFNKGIYKQYKLTSDKIGSIHCKSYHIMELSYRGETYGIYIPSYELPIFEELTGLKAQ